MKLKLAEKIISVENKYEYIQYACKDYVVGSVNYDFAVSASDEDLDKEISNSKEPVPEWYAEFICIYRKIAEQLPKYNRFVMHGAAITYKESGLLFVAPSGTGKSTHIKLWKDFFTSDVDIINGDKPILSIDNDEVYVYGTPWAGKEKWQKNRKSILKAICVIKQSKTNRIVKINPKDQLPMLLKQVYLPKCPVALKQTLELCNNLFENVPVFVLECDISKEAVLTAKSAIFGEI